jgi:cytochrome c5
MIAWGEILTSDQIQQLVRYIRTLKPASAEPSEPAAAPTAGPTAAAAAPTAAPTTEAAGAPSFSADVLPILVAKCTVCHGAQTQLGGWDGSSYRAVMSTGLNAPVIVPGNPEDSLLAQKLQGTQAEGALMPPAGQLPQDEIQVILDWIVAGAPDN